jgi:hypothetical protein
MRRADEEGLADSDQAERDGEGAGSADVRKWREGKGEEREKRGKAGKGLSQIHE